MSGGSDEASGEAVQQRSNICAPSQSDVEKNARRGRTGHRHQCQLRAAPGTRWACCSARRLMSYISPGRCGDGPNSRTMRVTACVMKSSGRMLDSSCSTVATNCATPHVHLLDAVTVTLMVSRVASAQMRALSNRRLPRGGRCRRCVVCAAPCSTLLASICMQHCCDGTCWGRSFS